MLYIIFMTIGVLLAIALITLILLHRGRGADVGVAFGGGASGTVFGSKGASSFLGRVIAVLSALFLINSLLLTYVANRDFTDQGILDQIEETSEEIQGEQAYEEESFNEDEPDNGRFVPEVPN